MTGGSMFFLSSYVSANQDAKNNPLDFKSYPVSSKMEGANFAGHYYVSSFFCGPTAICFNVKDLKTGGSTMFPNAYDMQTDIKTKKDPLFEYNVDSTLVIISSDLADPTKEEKNQGYRVRYYNFKDGDFVLIKNKKP